MIEIKKASVADIPAMLEVEKRCFCSEAWSESDFEYSMNNSGHTFLCAFCDGAFAGYIAASEFGDLNIDSIAVVPQYRRRGIAKKLLETVLEESTAEAAFLEVRISNFPAICLYKSFGFEEIYIRKGYYLEPFEDALIMKKELIS